MANRGAKPFEEFKVSAEQLATATLAYQLASDEIKPELKTLFALIAEHVQLTEPEPEIQAQYAKTLLGVKGAKAVETWVADNRERLLLLDSNQEWLAAVWSLFGNQSDDKFFHTIEPSSLSIQLASQWLLGVPYADLFACATESNGTKPWGTKRRRLTEDDVVDFCESTLGFQCSLVSAAVAQFLFGTNAMQVEDAKVLTLFQKALKYGLPSWLPISCLELGFADRVVAQRLSFAVLANDYTQPFFEQALVSHVDVVEQTLKEFPSYFESVLANRK